MSALRVIAGLVAGVVSGLLGVVTHTGPLDKPLVGLAIASAIVASGAWAMWEWAKFAAWVPYTLAVLGVTLVFTYFPPHDDSLFAATPVYTNVWVVASAVMSVVPVLVAIRVRIRDKA